MKENKQENVKDIVNAINEELNVVEKEIARHTQVQNQIELPPTYLFKLRVFMDNLAKYNQKLIKILNSKHDISKVANDGKTIIKSLKKLKDREIEIDRAYKKVLQFAEKHNLIAKQEGEDVIKIGPNPIIYKISKDSIDAFLKSNKELESAIYDIESNLKATYKRLYGIDI